MEKVDKCIWLPKEEQSVLKWWDETKASETQLERTKDLPEYVLYDGPPFATGLPHYGHILDGTIKDIVTRYQIATGHHVTRRFWWGSVEHEIDKKLEEVKLIEDVLNMGIDVYNEECTSIVTRYVGEWEKVDKRCGRWIAFDNEYKTRYLKFMESVWWVFAELYNKGLVYKGFKVTSPRGPEFGVLHRVEDVFDCWFANKELFDDNFPKHFVADQTRGWFYTLMVLSAALFKKPAFRNLICYGPVLAEDGKKMIERDENYPDPMGVIDKYGADALRLYLINSPVVRAEPLRFKEKGVKDVVKSVFLPWYNAYRFLVQNAMRLPEFVPLDQATLQNSANVLDQWINSATQSLVRFVRQEMDAYRLYTVVPYLLKFIDNLTNIYVRFNRKRLEGRTGEEDCITALSTLYHVLLTLCKVMAPFTPFFTELLFKNLRKVSTGSEESIHFCSFPQVERQGESRIEESVNELIRIVDLARNVRERHNKPLKTCLSKIIFLSPKNGFCNLVFDQLTDYVAEELNFTHLMNCYNPLEYATLCAELDLRSVSQDDILSFEIAGAITIVGHRLQLIDIKILRGFKCPDGDVLFIMELRADDYYLRQAKEVVHSVQKLRKSELEPTPEEIANYVQKLRKKSELEPTVSVDVSVLEFDPVDVYFSSPTDDVTSAWIIQSQEAYFKEALGSPLLHISMLPAHAVVIAEETYEYSKWWNSRHSHVPSRTKEWDFKITLARSLVFDDMEILELCSGNEYFVTSLRTYLDTKFGFLKSEFKKGNGKIKVDCIEKLPAVDLVLGQHVFLTNGDYLASQSRIYHNL